MLALFHQVSVTLAPPLDDAPAELLEPPLLHAATTSPIAAATATAKTARFLYMMLSPGGSGRRPFRKFRNTFDGAVIVELAPQPGQPLVSTVLPSFCRTCYHGFRQQLGRSLDHGIRVPCSMDIAPDRHSVAEIFRG